MPRICNAVFSTFSHSLLLVPLSTFNLFLSSGHDTWKLHPRELPVSTFRFARVPIKPQISGRPWLPTRAHLEEFQERGILTRSREHPTALSILRMRSLPTTAPMESQTMTSSCCQGLISSYWVFSLLLQPLSGCLEYINPAVSYLMRCSKSTSPIAPREIV